MQSLSRRAVFGVPLWAQCCSMVVTVTNCRIADTARYMPDVLNTWPAVEETWGHFVVLQQIVHTIKSKLCDVYRGLKFTLDVSVWQKKSDARKHSEVHAHVQPRTHTSHMT